MSVTINYPAKITKYSLSIYENKASVRLYGIEAESKLKENNLPICDIDFINVKNQPESKAFMNRGGFLNTVKDISLLSSILFLVNQKQDVYVTIDGNITTITE